MSEGVLLTPEQRERLQTLKASWEEGEGEEQLLFLRQRELDVETLRQLRSLLEERGVWSYDLTRRFLSLVRSLAPNPNLDARLLRSPGGPTRFQSDLRELLYGEAHLPLRLNEFLARRHAGGRTALQLLCVSSPAFYPLITAQNWKVLAPSEKQQQEALTLVTRRFFPEPETVPDETGLLPLAQAELFRAAKEEIEAEDYLSLHRLLTWNGEARPSRRRVLYPASSSEAVSVQESTPRYGFHEVDTSFSPQETPDVSLVSSEELLSELEAEIAAKGFTYDSLTVRSYYLSLQSKPFVLLSGLSGTGKSRLTALFAEALTGETETYLSLPVRPDWNDSAPLLGYVNYLAGNGAGRYVGTPFLDFLARALKADPHRQAFFLNLDEMNLARVEYYFAEVLSAMETERSELLLPNGQKVSLPSHLFFSGTLNLDEGTHSLSRKTLDRANVLSFPKIDLGSPSFAKAASPKIAPGMRQAVFLETRVQSVAQARARLGGVGGRQFDAEKTVMETLMEVNAILERGNAHFGYRVRDEILKFCAHSFDRSGAGLLFPSSPREVKANLKIALDLQLLQKILPRLSGTREQVETSLEDFRSWANVHEAPRTAERLERLQLRLRRDGFLLMD